MSGPTRTSITGDERKERLTFPGSVTWNQNLKFEEVKFHATNVALESCLMRGNLLFTAEKKQMNYRIIKGHYKGISKGISIGEVPTQQNRKVKVSF